MSAEPTSRPGAALRRSFLIGLAMFGLLLAAIALIVWIKGDAEPLPFEYEGF